MTPPVKPAPVIPVAIWAVLQLALLGCGASGFPLWAHHPFPRESLALQVLLCGQVLLFGILSPMLATSWVVLAINGALMFPMDELAALLSNASQAEVLRSFLCVSLWCAGLGAFCRVCCGRTSELVICGCGALFIGGGVVLDYLRWETLAGRGISEGISPISILPAIIWNVHRNAAVAWGESGAPLVALLLFVAVRSIWRKWHQSASTSPHQLQNPVNIEDFSNR